MGWAGGRRRRLNLALAHLVVGDAQPFPLGALENGENLLGGRGELVGGVRWLFSASISQSASGSVTSVRPGAGRPDRRGHPGSSGKKKEEKKKKRKPGLQLVQMRQADAVRGEYGVRSTWAVLVSDRQRGGTAGSRASGLGVGKSVRRSTARAERHPGRWAAEVAQTGRQPAIGCAIGIPYRAGTTACACIRPAHASGRFHRARQAGK